MVYTDRYIVHYTVLGILRSFVGLFNRCFAQTDFSTYINIVHAKQSVRLHGERICVCDIYCHMFF